MIIKLASLILLILLCVGTASAQVEPWVQCNGPYGGEVYCLAKTSSGKILSGTDKGIYQSYDDGLTWERVPSNLANEEVVTILAVDSTLLACTGDGIFYSFDSGNTWNKSEGLTKNIIVNDIIDGATGEFFAEVGYEVFKSTDRGMSWQSCNQTASDMCQDSSGNLYALDIIHQPPYPLSLSTDGGQTWSQTLPGIASNGWPVPFECTSIQANNEGYLFAATDSLVWRSNDRGKNWQSINIGDYPNDEVRVLSVSPGHVFGTDYQMGVFYQSSDNGTSWNSSSFSPPRRPDPTSILVLNNGYILVGTDSGVERSTDGALNWSVDADGIRNCSVSSMVARSSGDVIAVGSAGLYHSSDNGNHWTCTSSTPYTQGVSSLLLTPNDILLAGTEDGMYRSTDNAMTWQVDTDLNQGGISLLRTLPDGGVVCLWDSYRITRIVLSPNGSDSWQNISQSLELQSTLEDSSFSALAVDSAGNIFLCTDAGNIYRTSDRGTSWTRITALSMNDYVLNMCITKTGTLFIALYGMGALRSDDGGYHWSSLNNELLDSNIIQGLALDGDTLYAMFYDSGIYRSQDFGTSWQSMNEGLLSGTVNCVARSPNGYLFAGMDGDGVYRTGALKSDVGLAANQNNEVTAYPNPCSDLIHIQHSFEHPTKERLTVINSLGEIVLRRELSSGNENGIDIDMSSLTSGAYLIELITPYEKASMVVIVEK